MDVARNTRAYCGRSLWPRQGTTGYVFALPAKTLLSRRNNYQTGMIYTGVVTVPSLPVPSLREKPHFSSVTAKSPVPFPSRKNVVDQTKKKSTTAQS